MVQLRHLLFHRGGIDDNTGTYVTNYVISLVCFVIFLCLACLIRRHKQSDDVRFPDQAGWRYWAPWDWPRQATTSVTMVTYFSLLFVLFYMVMFFLGGLVHQFLQKTEPYRDWHDSYTWLILWRCSVACAVGEICILMTMSEQMVLQEKCLNFPRKARVVYYVITALVGTAGFFLNVWMATHQDDPYHVTAIYLVFLCVVLLHGIVLLFINIHERIKRQKRREETEKAKQPLSKGRTRPITNRGTRWDLVLHCMFPWILVNGGLFSFILSPMCSHDDAYKTHGCPLPDNFNHNVVMHLIHVVALVCLGASEVLAIRRRQSLM